jgi:hypothetical protein
LSFSLRIVPLKRSTQAFCWELRFSVKICPTAWTLNPGAQPVGDALAAAV